MLILYPQMGIDKSMNSDNIYNQQRQAVSSFKGELPCLKEAI